MTRLHRTIPALTALGLAALPQPGRADTPIELGEIVVSANLTPTPANKVGATVDVVTAEDLKSAAQGSVANALALVPGLNITPAGGVGHQTGFTLRGAGQNYVGVLIDGIEVTDPSGTQLSFDFGHLGIGGISRIEVLKGSQSALYGSSAVGGVIDITSRHATEEGVHHYVDVEAGTYKTANASYSFTAKTGNSDFALTLSHTGTSGFASYIGPYANGYPEGYWSNRAAANGSYTLENGVKLGFAAFIERNHGRYHPGFVEYYVDNYNPVTEPQYYPLTPAEVIAQANARQTSRTHGLRVYAEFQTGAVKNTISAQTFRISRHYAEYPQYIDSWGYYVVGNDNTYVGTRTKLSYLGTTALGAAAQLSFGADSTREGLDEWGSYGSVNGTRRLNGVFTELAYSPTQQVDLTAALRQDHDSRFGGRTTGRLALAWRPSADLTVRASAGTGFRAPSNYELFSTYYGNPNLQPEESRSVDLGVEKRFAGESKLRATAFWLSVDNLIGFNVGTSKYDQISGTSRRYGVEIEGETLVAGKVTLKGSYTYTDSSTNAASWAVVPRHVGVVTVSAPLTAALTGALTVKGAADRASLPNFIVANADFTYDLGNRAEAYLRLENLFDSKYQLVEDYATPGRSIYVGLRKSF